MKDTPSSGHTHFSGWRPPSRAFSLCSCEARVIHTGRRVAMQRICLAQPATGGNALLSVAECHSAERSLVMAGSGTLGDAAGKGWPGRGAS